MAIFPIRTFGDPVLRTPAEPIDELTSAVERLIDDMFETMFAAPGVGLAAPQIGVSKQLFVADFGDGEPFAMFNPVIIAESGEWTFEEGCLSVPGRFWPIERSGYVVARGYDRTGVEVEVAGDELKGRLLQHEIDHLGGTLLIQRLSKRERRQVLRELREEALGVYSAD